MSHEEIQPAKYEWKQYAVSLSVAKPDFNDIRNVITYLRIRRSHKRALKAISHNINTQIYGES